MSSADKRWRSPFCMTQYSQMIIRPHRVNSKKDDCAYAYYAPPEKKTSPCSPEPKNCL